MFPCDPAILAAVQTSPVTIPDVLQVLRTIDGACAEADGLKWFNWLYLTVTQAVETRVNSGGFADPAWLAQLDVQFAALYFSSLRAALSGAPCPDCWGAVYLRARQPANRENPVCACGDERPYQPRSVPRRRSHLPGHEYRAATWHDPVQRLHLHQFHARALIDEAKQTLNVRLPGDPLPAVTILKT